MRGMRGFTLIEMMISVAILAIIMSIATASLFNFGAPNRQATYSQSLSNGQAQLAQLRELPFESLPPQVATVTKNSTVQLGQARLVEGSLSVRSLSTGQSFSVESVSGSGLVTLERTAVGQSVMVDFEFFLPGYNETHFVGESGLVTLNGGPLIALERVFLADGDKLQPLVLSKDVTLTQSGELKFSKTMVGRLIVVDYEGDQFRNLVSGRFLDSALNLSEVPTETKLLEVKEPFEGPFRLSLALLKEATP